MIRSREVKEEIKYLEDSLEKVSRELEKLRSKAPDGARLRAARHTTRRAFGNPILRSGRVSRAETRKRSGISCTCPEK